MYNLDQKYSEIIKKNPLLTRKEEYELAKKTQNGDELAREKLIASNYRLVKSIAKKYHRNNIDFNDLFQESSIGLIEAVDRFDPEQGNKLSTYATWWIKQAALKFINESQSDIKVPTHSRFLNARIKKSAKSLEEKLGRKPTIEEIAKDLNESPKKINYTIKANGTITYLDKENSDDNNSYKSTLKDSFKDESPYIDPEKLMLSKELDNLIRQSLSLLSSKEEKIIRLRFGITEDDDNIEDFPVTNEMSAYLEDNDDIETMEKLVGLE